MRTRTQILLAFMLLHCCLAAALGLGSWLVIDGELKRQAEDGARRVAELIAAGGFDHQAWQGRMQQLTGFAYTVSTLPQGEDAGVVEVQRSGASQPVVVRIDYRTDAYRRLSWWIFIASVGFALAGLIAAWPIAWWLAARIAQPVEQLVTVAQRIGAGDWQKTVSAQGNQEVVTLASELEQMRCQLIALDHRHRQAERLATVGTFTATIAHEVRNPLSAVRLSVQLLARRHGKDDGLTLIQEELERLDLIVDQLLAFSRGMDIAPERCRLEELTEDVCRLLRRQAEHTGVTLSWDGQAQVHADPNRIRQLLLNLVLNAIQAQHDQGGRVQIHILADGLVVEDQGPGISPEQQASLFEAFSSNRSGGTGLGLHLARSIAEAHGAVLRYEPSNPGSRFVLRGLEA